MSGKVISGGGPVAEAEISFMSGDLVNSTQTNSDGQYEVRVWHLADFGVFIKHPETGILADSCDLRSAEIGENVEKDFEFPAASIECFIIAKENGKPIPSALVWLKLELSDNHRTISISEKSDERGRVVFDKLPEALRATLAVKKEGYSPFSMDVNVIEDETEIVWVELETGDRFDGVVKGPAGEKIPGAVVKCSFAGVFGPALETVVSDANGNFELESVSDSIAFGIIGGYGLGWSKLQSGNENVLRLPPLQADGKIRLVNSEGEPISGAAVAVSQRTNIALTVPVKALEQSLIINGFPTRTTQDGEISLAVLPNGEYLVSLVGRSGLIAGGYVTLPSNQIQEVKMGPL